MLDTSKFPHIQSFIIRVQTNFIVCKNLDWSALFMRLIFGENDRTVPLNQRNCFSTVQQCTNLFESKKFCLNQRNFFLGVQVQLLILYLYLHACSCSLRVISEFHYSIVYEKLCHIFSSTYTIHVNICTVVFKKFDNKSVI